MPAPDAAHYFDHAATSFPKPPGVVEAVSRFLTDVGSAGRGDYREAADAARVLTRCRTAIRRLFNAAPADHVVFALNGTDALNLAIRGALRPGEHAVTTVMEHNSVLRPLAALQQQIGIDVTTLPVDPATTRLSIDALAAALRPTTRLVAVQHASNVTGALQPLDDIAALCRARGVLLLVDAAQTAGHVPLDLTHTPIDLLATSGHKGLQGPLGTGVLLVRAGVERELRTVREGGTGSQSEQPLHPEQMPDKLEAGSHNTPGLAGLLAALEWIERQGGPTALRRHESELSALLAAELDRCPNLTWYGPRRPDERLGVFSVTITGHDPHELSMTLEQRLGYRTRSGLHCAPLAHKTLATLDAGGTTRASLGPLHTAADIQALAQALSEVASST